MIFFKKIWSGFFPSCCLALQNAYFLELNSIQGVKSLWRDRVVFLRLGTTGDTDRWRMDKDLFATCQCPQCPTSEKRRDPPKWFNSLDTNSNVRLSGKEMYDDIDKLRRENGWKPRRRGSTKQSSTAKVRENATASPAAPQTQAATPAAAAVGNSLQQQQQQSSTMVKNSSKLSDFSSNVLD